MTEKILLVDDDELLLAAMQRTLGRQYHLVTALSAEIALKLLANEPFAVIVSDLRMPKMDGITFLIQAKTISPDSTRIMLTGNGDLQTAMTAINESHIFRFLIKPVSQAVMSKALEAGLTQYRLVMAERELLSKTLMGSVQMLIDLLRTLYPGAAQLAGRIRKRTRAIAERLQLPDLWQYELAALLSHVGLITAPPSLLEKLQTREFLNSKEQSLLAEHMIRGHSLLSNIPRLETIAEMIGKQHQMIPRTLSRSALKERDATLLGAQILQVATAFEYYLSRYGSDQSALIHLYHEDRYDPFILDLLRETIASSPQVTT